MAHRRPSWRSSTSRRLALVLDRRWSSTLSFPRSLRGRTSSSGEMRIRHFRVHTFTTHSACSQLPSVQTISPRTASSKSTSSCAQLTKLTYVHRKRTHIIRVIGQFVAKAMLDSRIIDLSCNKIFLKLVLSEEVPLTIDTLRVRST